MPVSNVLHLPIVMHYIGALKPIRVLDVGVGMGNFGLFTREFFDMGEERLERKDWQLTIDGIEIFERYRNPIWNFAYDNITVGDARDALRSAHEYDLILLNDVLEHFELEDAIAVHDRCLQLAGAVIVTTPNRDYPQGAWGGNEAERHRCEVERKHLKGVQIVEPCGDTDCFVSSLRSQIAANIVAAAAYCPRYAVRRGRPFHVRAAGRLRRIFQSKS